MDAVQSTGSPLGNVLTLGVTFFLTRVSWISTLALLDAESGLTRTVLNVVLFASAAFSLFLTVPVVARFGHKRVLLVGIFLFALFASGNIRPSAGLFIPLALLCGLGLALTSVSGYSYVVHLAKKESLKNTLHDRVFLFMGIVCTFNFLADLGAATLAHFVTDRPSDTSPSLTNYSCGVDYCQSTSAQRTTISGSLDNFPCVFMLLPLVAVFLVTVCLNCAQEDPEDLPPIQRKARELFLSAINPIHFLLSPLAFYVGVQKYFLIEEFIQAYVGCDWGAVQASAVLICSLGVGGVLSLLLATWVRDLDRAVLFSLAASLQVATLAVLWNTSTDTGHLYYAVAVAFGVSDAIWQAPLKVLWSLLFRCQPESGLALLTSAELLGLALSSTWTSSLCLRTKLAILTVLLPLGMLGYGAAEFLMRSRKIVDDSVEYQPLTTGKVCKAGPVVRLDVSVLDRDSSFLHRDKSGMHPEGACRMSNNNNL